MWFNIETYAYSYFLWGLLIIPIAVWLYIKRNKQQKASIRLSSTRFAKNTKKGIRLRLMHTPFILRMFGLAALIIALARPQSTSSKQNISIEGIDIVMAMDISSSMLAEDFKPNRLEAAKDVASNFISNRPNDRIGLVVFSGESFTQCPLTSDHSVMTNLFKDINSGIIEDGTAIGDGMSTAINRLKDSEAISKVIILLTDGENNRGSIDPVSAAEIAKKMGVRLYTIGIGTIGQAPYPFRTPFGIQYQNMEVKIDEALLKEMASITEGKYFRATNKAKLKDIYQEIDQLEKSKIDISEYRKKTEEFFFPALIAALLIVLEFILRYTYLKKLP